MPDEIVVDNAKYNLYLARFNNIYELYEYLKSNPRINDIVFSDLAEDFENAIRRLKLEDKIDVEKAKKEFSEQVKILEKKK